MFHNVAGKVTCVSQCRMNEFDTYSINLFYRKVMETPCGVWSLPSLLELTNLEWMFENGESTRLPMGILLSLSAIPNRLR